MWGLKTAMRMPKCVQVEWEDGLLAKFNYLWLRDNTTKRPSLVHLDLNMQPEAVDCSRDALNLVWPPFMKTNYSSDFLRQNAMQLQSQHSAQMCTQPINVRSIAPSTSTSGTLPGSAWMTVNATNIDLKHVAGQFYWQDTAQECQTIWPHMQKIPAVCAVESLNEHAELFVVDSLVALETLERRYPKALEFLSQCVLEYSEGLFKSRHPVCQLLNGKIVQGVFNNAARSSAITVESLDMLYESLQKFGRICAESTHSIHLVPGQRLLVDNTKAMLGAPAQAGRRVMIKCLS